jgi:NTP pyrophosphatase (non-canonical NTP hydrolase)
MNKAWVSVYEERNRQDGKWGIQDHAPEWWLAILTEEVGELAQAILNARAKPGDKPEVEENASFERIREEAVQCAAVAVAFVEWIDRDANIRRMESVVAEAVATIEAEREPNRDNSSVLT